MQDDADGAARATRTEEIGFDDLLESAECVLSGKGNEGILAAIADMGDRIRFASSIWLEGAGGTSSDFWYRNLQNMLRDNGADTSRLSVDENAMCLCGYPLFSHAERGRIDLDGQSRAQHIFFLSRRLEPIVRQHRAEAHALHPVLMNFVIDAAYDGHGPWSRRDAAWRLIEAIDQRRPLIDALAAFFRVGPAAIRAFRHWRTESPQLWLTCSSARRTAAMLALLPHEFRAELDAREVWRWLPVAHVVFRSTGVRPDYMMSVEFLDGIERLIAIKPVRRKELRRKIRHAIRWLRTARRENGGLPRPRRLLAAIGVPPPSPVPLNYCYALPAGWLAAPLDTPEAVREEGATMHHCLGRSARDIMRGEIQAYSLRSLDGSERATLVIRKWYSIEEADRWITLAGRENGVVSIEAITAMVALLGFICPDTYRVHLS